MSASPGSAEPAGPAPPSQGVLGLTELLFLALAAAPFAIDYRGAINDYADLPQGLFVLVSSSAALAWVARRASAAGSARPLLTSWHAALALFLAWCGLTGLWARSGLEWWLEWRHLLTAGAVGAAAAAAGGKARPWALAAFFTSAVLTSVLALLQYYEVRPFSLILQAVPPSATFGHRSFAMHWLVLGAPFGVVLWARAGSQRALWSTALASGLLAGVALLASARASWLGGAAEALLLGAWLWGEFRRGTLGGPPGVRAASAAGGLLLALALALTARSDYAARYGDFSHRMSAMVTGLSGAPDSEVQTAAIPVNNVRMRLAIWRNSSAIIKRRPWRGAGLGNFQVHYPWFSRAVVDDGVNRDNLFVDHAHNDPLELLAETGVIGVLLALLLAAAAARPAAAQLRSDDAWDRAAAAAYVAALAGIVVTSLFCLPAHRALPPFAAMLFMGALAGRGAGRPWTIPSRALAPAAAAAGALTLAAGVFAFRQLLGDAHYGRANGSIMFLTNHPNAPEGMPPEEWARRRAAVLRAIDRDADVAAALSPTPHTLYTRGSILTTMGRWDEALAVFIPFTERRPNHMRALVNLSLALMAKGRADEALSVAGRAVNIRPTSAKGLHALGAAQQLKGLYAEAAGSFARAAASDPGNPQYPLKEGFARKAAGDKPGAKAAFERALAADPRCAEAAAALKAL